MLWDAECILFIDYLEKGKTITGEYSNLLARLDEKIREKRPDLQKKKIIHQDNAPAHESVLAMGKLRNLHLNCCNIHPIPQLWLPLTSIFSQNSYSGRRFPSTQEAMAAVEGCFADLTKNHYRDGIMALEHRWNKCISLKGDYVEK